MSHNVIKLVPLHEVPEESPLVIKCAADIKPEKSIGCGRTDCLSGSVCLSLAKVGSANRCCLRGLLRP
jgi:hypothetical protein